MKVEQVSARIRVYCTELYY